MVAFLEALRLRLALSLSKLFFWNQFCLFAASNDPLVSNISLDASLRHHRRQLLPLMDLLPVTDFTANVLQRSV